VLEALGSSSDGIERLERFARAMLARGQDPARVQVLADLWATVGDEEAVRRAFSDSVGRRRSVLRGWIQASIEAGELVELPPNALASILLALGDGLLLHAAMDAAAFQWSRVSNVVLLLLEGLRR
jgi:hypothetical protein